VSSGSAPAAIRTAPCTQWRRFECPTFPGCGVLGQPLRGEPFEREPFCPARSARKIGVGRQFQQDRRRIFGACDRARRHARVGGACPGDDGESQKCTPRWFGTVGAQGNI
jgi:hypothetical protein